MGTINYGYNKYFNIGMNLSPDYDEYDYMGEFNYLIEETQEILKKYTFDYCSCLHDVWGCFLL